MPLSVRPRAQSPSAATSGRPAAHPPYRPSNSAAPATHAVQPADWQTNHPSTDRSTDRSTDALASLHPRRLAPAAAPACSGLRPRRRAQRGPGRAARCPRREARRRCRPHHLHCPARRAGSPPRPARPSRRRQVRRRQVRRGLRRPASCANAPCAGRGARTRRRLVIRPDASPAAAASRRPPNSRHR